MPPPPPTAHRTGSGPIAHPRTRVALAVRASLIGRDEGYPSFSVMIDPQHELDATATAEELAREVEELFEHRARSLRTARAPAVGKP